MDKLIGLPKIFEFPAVKIDRRNRLTIEAGVLKMIRRIRPDWPKEDIILVCLSEGQRLTASDNILWGGYTCDRSQMVLVKIFRENNPEDSKGDEIGLMRIFAHNHLTARVYASFSNGIAYEYINGSNLDYRTSVDNKVYPVIAKKVGYMHRVMSKVAGKIRATDSTPHIFNMLRNWLMRVPYRLADPINHNRMMTELPSKATLVNELDELELRIMHWPPTPSGDRQYLFEEPVLVFCHNDLNPGNIIYDAVSRNVSFIHLEFAGINFQALELARHFYTLCGSDVNRVGSADYVPAPEFQMRWIQNYLSSFKDVPMQRISLEEIDKLYMMVQKFALVFMLQEIIWSLIKVEDSSNLGAKIPEDFDILGYGVKRYQQYRKAKYNILSLNI